MAFRPLVFAALAALAAICLAFLPMLVARLKGTAEARPGMTPLTGGVGLSFLFGLVLFGTGAIASAIFNTPVGVAGPERDAALTPIGETGPGA